METSVLPHGSPVVPPVHARPEGLVQGHRDAHGTHDEQAQIAQAFAPGTSPGIRLLYRRIERGGVLFILHQGFQPRVQQRASFQRSGDSGRVEQGGEPVHHLLPEARRVFTAGAVRQYIPAEDSKRHPPRPGLHPRLESEVDVPYQESTVQRLDILVAVAFHHTPRPCQRVEVRLASLLRGEVRQLRAVSPIAGQRVKLLLVEVVGHVLYQETGGSEFQAVVLIVPQHMLQFLPVLTGKRQGTLQRDIPAARREKQEHQASA